MSAAAAVLHLLPRRLTTTLAGRHQRERPKFGKDTCQRCMPALMLLLCGAWMNLSKNVSEFYICMKVSSEGRSQSFPTTR